MADLLVLKALDPESAGAPEFRYLLSQVLLAARRAFGSVRFLGDPAGLAEPPSLAGETAVLGLGPQNALLAEASLRAMRDALAAGAMEARPTPLAEAGLALEAPVYTLRGYERAEATFLAQIEHREPPPSHLPVALWSAERFAEIIRQVPIDRLLLDPAALAGLPGSTVAAGLCHTFIDYYGEVREDVLPFVPADAREVLEIGCGRGLTGEFLQRTLGCRVTGVELNPEVARDAARRLHAVHSGDVQTLEILPPADGFDAVLALELFEHLTDSERFLARARELLRPGGRLVLSVPNVGHWAVVEDLLAGRWDYLPIGLLCYTHYRFFTRRTLADWLARCGFERAEIVAQTTELPERFDRLDRLGASGETFGVDRESLATKGFYVVAFR
ncbi:MAG TPA: methyltransferase domain-containing protein [Thermoanaerobaculia bacterium]|jgi:SAM-dependent methyltransferase